MALPQGINFRATAAFVTDGTNESAETATQPDYPRTTTQGNTVGWEAVQNFQTRDRNASNDRRLAGIVFPQTATNIDKFRIDLPASGSYNLRFAAGDANNAIVCDWDIYDGTTKLFSITTGSTSAANSFKDATNTQLTAANWPASNSINTKTFTTTICRVQNPGVDTPALAHFYIESAAVATATPLRMRMGMGV